VALDDGECSALCHGCFIPKEKKEPLYLLNRRMVDPKVNISAVEKDQLFACAWNRSPIHKFFLIGNFGTALCRAV
jgi:hypothetical protein